MTIRIAKPMDAANLSELGRRSFFEKWKDTTSPENMAAYLDQTFTPEIIEQEIADPSVIYLIAEENSGLAGYAKLMHTYPDLEEAGEHPGLQSKNPLEISRIYVEPKRIGQSIGALLMQRIFEIAGHESCDLVWLGVWEQNPAVHFYERHGFVKIGTHKFIFGNQVDTDMVMVKKL